MKIKGIIAYAAHQYNKNREIAGHGIFGAESPEDAMRAARLRNSADGRDGPDGRAGTFCIAQRDKKQKEVAFCVRGTNSAEKIMKKTCKSNCITPENMV